MPKYPVYQPKVNCLVQAD